MTDASEPTQSPASTPTTEQEREQHCADQRAQTAARLTEIEAQIRQDKAESSVRHSEMAEQFRAGDERMTRLEASMAENTTLTTEIRDIIVAAKGFFRAIGRFAAGAGWVVRKLAVVAKPVGVLAAAAVAIWQLISVVKTGSPTDINLPK